MYGARWVTGDGWQTDGSCVLSWYVLVHGFGFECGMAEENLRTESSGEEIFTNIIITTYAEAR